jgi:hypothetical protein
LDKTAVSSAVFCSSPITVPVLVLRNSKKSPVSFFAGAFQEHRQRRPNLTISKKNRHVKSLQLKERTAQHLQEIITVPTDYCLDQSTIQSVVDNRFACFNSRERRGLSDDWGFQVPVSAKFGAIRTHEQLLHASLCDRSNASNLYIIVVASLGRELDEADSLGLYGVDLVLQNLRPAPANACIESPQNAIAREQIHVAHKAPRRLIEC